MAGAAPPHSRNLAAPAAFAQVRQRSSLAQLLAAVDPANAEVLAGRLLGEFGSLPRIWTQSAEAIGRVAGKGSPVISLLHAVGDAVREAGRADLHENRISPTNPKLIAYLQASMGSLPDETLRVLFLDGARRLLADEQMQTGTIDMLCLYPRIVFRRALELNAAAIILVHNHPSGDPAPSRADVLATQRLADIGQSLGVEIAEHIVVTATDHRCILRTDHDADACAPTSQIALHADQDGPGATGLRDCDSHAALANARRTERRRLLRRQLLGADALFGEPAWDMLIELFIHQREGKLLATSSLCVGTGLSMSSALRLVQRMIDADLLVRQLDAHDRRRHYVYLSPEIEHRLLAFFAEHDE